MRYYAIFDPEDQSRTPRNLFLVDRRDDLLAMLIVDRTQHRWVNHPGLIEYIGGEKADRCLPIDDATAARLARSLGVQLPTEQELFAVAAEPPANS